MPLPFTKEQFFDLFIAYNEALWPAVVALWTVSAVIVALRLSTRHPHDRWVSALLVGHWAWSAVAYHAAFFSRINPAAWLFAALFLGQAVLFFRVGVVQRRLSFSPWGNAWAPLAWGLIAYSLAYPAINAIEHHSLLRIPTFGLPCPTTIFTVGVLMLATPRCWSLAIVPMIWAATGGSATFLLGVYADVALPIAGIALALFSVSRTRPALGIWLTLAAVESIHGVLRRLFLEPQLGDLRARQVSVFTGAVLITVVFWFTLRWVGPQPVRRWWTLGLLWLALTLTFEIGLGRATGMSWDRITSDFDPRRGGFLAFGMLVILVAPRLLAQRCGLIPDRHHRRRRKIRRRIRRIPQTRTGSGHKQRILGNRGSFMPGKVHALEVGSVRVASSRGRDQLPVRVQRDTCPRKAVSADIGDASAMGAASLRGGFSWRS